MKVDITPICHRVLEDRILIFWFNGSLSMISLHRGIDMTCSPGVELKRRSYRRNSDTWFPFMQVSNLRVYYHSENAFSVLDLEPGERCSFRVRIIAWVPT